MKKEEIKNTETIACPCVQVEVKKRLVIFDPGHGGVDPGAVELATGRKESEDVLKLYQECKKHLINRGLKVATTREANAYVDLYSRPQLADRLQGDIFISLHRNSAPKSSTLPHGVEIWVHPKAPAEDTALANAILKELVLVGVQGNRGVKKGNYTVLTCKVPAVMVELGFMNNVKDNQLFDQNLKRYAGAIGKGVLKFLSGR